MSTIYVTGHRNPDTDSIASAIGYAELRQRLDPGEHYVAVRLGDVNAQTAWALERAGLDPPEFLAHIMLRARDVMRPTFAAADHNASLRDVGLAMAKGDLDLIPIVDDDGAIAGQVTARDLARRYMKESGEPSSFADRPVSVDLIVEVLGGELRGPPRAHPERPAVGRDRGRREHGRHDGPQRHRADRGPRRRPAPGDRDRHRPARDALRPAPRRRGAGAGAPHGHRHRAVAARLLRDRPDGVPVGAGARGDEPRPARPWSPTTCCPTSRSGSRTSTTARPSRSTRPARPVGLVSRADLVNPAPGAVLLVDHGEQAQSVPGVEQAHIVEILDHHHIGSIETTLSGGRDLRPGGQHRDAGGGAVPLAWPRAPPPDGDDAARGGALRHGHPQLTHRHGARPAGGALPGGAARARRPRVRPRDVRGVLGCGGRRRVRDRAARLQGVRGPRRTADQHRPDRDRRAPGGSPPRAAGRARARPRSRPATRSSR